MTDQADIEAKFWKALESDRVAMLEVAGIEGGQSQPMSAQLLPDETVHGPIWFFTSKETDLARSLGNAHHAMLHFSSKGHHLFASVQGELSLSDDRAVIDRLWNRYVAAWFEGGKEDPKLQLMRFDPDHAQVWLNEHTLVAGVKLMLGRDPKREYREKVADIPLGRH
jgi:general stress protein 26